MISATFLRVWDLLNISITTYTWFLRSNANREIKKAEKLLARYHVARMAGKAGTGNDKSVLKASSSAAFNAYVVGTTSFNATEAAARAHELQVSSTHKKIEACIIIQTLLNCILLIVTGKIYKIPIVIVAAIINITLDNPVKYIYLHVQNAVTAHSMTHMALEGLYVLAAWYDIVPNNLREVFGGVYCLVTAAVVLLL